jgi:membrane protein YqaA with SNARE-associated domain
VNIFALPVHPAASHPHHPLVPHWVAHLGPLGLFLIAIVDSSIVPLPIPGTTDLLLLLFVSHRGNPWLLAGSAIAGSVIGGYTTWHLGRRGGEAALHRWVPAALLSRIVGWVGHHPLLAVFLPTLLPPPIPLSPFILASGALGVERHKFLATYSAARILRYGLIAWLGVAYGRGVVSAWSGVLQKWSAPLLWTFAVVSVAGIAYAIYKLRNTPKGTPRQSVVAGAGRGD